MHAMVMLFEFVVIAVVVCSKSAAEVPKQPHHTNT